MGASPATSSEQSKPLLPPPKTTYGFPINSPFEDNPPAYLLLPIYPHRRRRRRHCCCLQILSASSSLIAVFFSLLLLSSSVFLLWPSNPRLAVASLRLNRFRVSPPPAASIDISMGLKIEIRNPDFLAIDYDSIVASISYRGGMLGSVSAAGGRVAARGVSYVDADLRLDGVRVLEDVVFLIRDVAMGSVEFDTVTEVEGWVRLFFFDVPIKVKGFFSVYKEMEMEVVRLIWLLGLVEFRVDVVNWTNSLIER